MIVFGVRSPLVVDYEETCHRVGVRISAAVSVAGTPRVMDSSVLVDLVDLRPEPDAAFVACAFTPSRRRELWDLAREHGLRPAQALVDPHAVLARSVRVGAGSFVNAGVVFGAVCLVGENVLVNRAVSVGHHGVIGDDVSIGPGATLAGNVHVGTGAMIGAGATVLPDVRIGDGAIVAAGSLVRREVPAGAFVAGSPAVERTFDPGTSRLHLEGAE